MKYFKKIAAEITGANTPQVAAPKRVPPVKSRTTPVKSTSKSTNSTISTKAGNNTNVGVAGNASINKTAKFKDDLEYFKYVAGHKARIYRPGRDLGLRVGQMLRHDNSKFSRKEWGPYRDYFYSDKGIKGENLPETHAKFREAVEHHYDKNPHHNTEGAPFRFRVEEIVDWYAAAKTQATNPREFPSFEDWYLANHEKFITQPRKRVGPVVDEYIIRSFVLK